jgi:hypothetical protein
MTTIPDNVAMKQDNGNSPGSRLRSHRQPAVPAIAQTGPRGRLISALLNLTHIT